VAILLPEDDVQSDFTPGHVSVTEEMKKRISPELMSTILDAGYNIDYIDAATIDKLNKNSYPVLVMPSVSRISLDAFKKIEAYAAAGGKVIAIGKLPSLAPGLMQQCTSAEISALSARLFESTGHKGVELDWTAKLADTLHLAIAPDMDVQSPAAGVGFIHRRLADSDVYFVVNSSNRSVDTTVRFRSSRPQVESWNPDAGNLVNATACKPEKFLPLQLAPYESRVFVFHGEAGPKPAQDCGHEMVPRHIANTTDLNSDWKIRFADQSSADALKKLTSWTDLDARKYYSGEVVYTRTVNVAHAPAKDAVTFLDFGEGIATVDPRSANAPGTLALLDAPIRETAIVYVNGKRVGSLWHPPYRLDISSFLRTGENQIEVHVYNTAVNEMAGQPRRDYTALNAKYGKRFDPQDMDNLQPIPSGLLGPIRIVEERY
jgi:hypothetical protein